MSVIQAAFLTIVCAIIMVGLDIVLQRHASELSMGMMGTYLALRARREA